MPEKEEVTITEISEDDKTLIAISEATQAIVTQPEDKKEEIIQEVEDEELIIVGEKSSEKIQQKNKKPGKQREINEVEIEELEEDKEIKEVKKTIRTRKSDVEEEIIEEEFLETLDVHPAKGIRGLPVKTSIQVGESVPEALVSLIGEMSTSEEKGTVSVILLSAIEKQVVQGAEQEVERPDTMMPDSVRAKQSIDTVDSYSVIQPQTEIVADEFSTTFKPTTQEAMQSFIPKESVVVSEIRVDHSVVESRHVSEQSSQATVSILLHEAKLVTENESSIKEGSVQADKQPMQMHADKSLVLQESICVTEVTQGQSEHTFEGNFKPTPVKPKIELPQTESLVVSQVFAEDKPGKYFPELIVPTEVATSTVVAQKQTAFTEVMNLAEKEGEYIPGRMPQSQHAGLDITPGDSIIISQINIHEREIDFAADRRPELTCAQKDISLVEGIAVSLDQHIDKESVLKVDKHETKTIDVKFSPYESIVTQETNISENEMTFLPGETPGGKSADTSITCLETSGVSETTIQEATGDFVPFKSPSAIFAEKSIRPKESVSVIETRAEDVPGEFTDILKYRSDSALPNFETLEAKEISVIHPQDSEKPLANFEKPTTCAVDSGFRSQESVSIYQTEIVEKEGDHPKYTLPEAHKGRTVPSHPLQSLVVEETLLKGDLGDLKDSQPQAVTAKVEHTTFQETVVEETVYGEGVFSKKTEKKPENRLANLTVLEEEGITVIEVITEDKEGEYEKPNLPSECFALLSQSTQKVALQSEVKPEQLVAPLLDTAPDVVFAKSEQLPLESVLISSTQIAESESELTKDFKPDTKQANIEMSDELTSITVQQIVSNEKEIELIQSEKPNEIKASKSISAHIIAVQSEVLPDILVGDLSQVKPFAGKAKIDSVPLQEIVVTETNITEIEKLLEDTVKPKHRKATLGIRVGKSLAVTEVVTEDKEETFKSKVMPEQRKAVLDLSGQKVAEKQEVFELVQEGLFKRQSPIKEQALLEQDTIQLAVSSQPIIRELEGEFISPLKPEEKAAALTFEKGNVLSVTEVNVVDKESTLDISKAPMTAVAVPDIVGQGVATTSEVVVDINVEGISDFKLDLSEAKVKQSTFESIILQETMVAEQEGEYTIDFQPDTKKAETGIVESHNVSVSSIVTTQDKESTLITHDKPIERVAELEVIKREVAEKTEVVVESSVGNLVYESPVSAQALAKQLPFKSVIFSETSTVELEGVMKDDIQPETKVAEVLFEETSKGVSVTEILAQNETSKFVALEKPENKFATPEIFGREVAQQTIIVPENNIGEIPSETPLKAVANPKQIPFESIVTDVISVGEKENVFSETLKFDTQSAEMSFEERKSCTITQVISEDKESILLDLIKPKEMIAHPDIIGQEIAQKSEVLPEISVGKVPELVVTTACATLDQDMFEGIILTETSVQESEGKYTGDLKPLTSKAELGFIEEKGVMITEVILDDKEDKYTVPTLPESKVAHPNITSNELPQTSEIILQDSFSEANITKPETAMAKLLQSTLKSIQTHLTTTGETEIPISDFIAPFSKKAETMFESAKSGINITEITPQDKEGILEIAQKPTESFAEPEILTKEIALKSEILIENTTSKFSSKIPETVCATVIPLPHQSVILSVTSTGERESDYVGLIKPDLKNAGICFEEGTGLSVVEVVTGDQESSLLVPEKPDTKCAISEITGQEIAVKTEIVIGSTVSEVDTVLPTLALANIDRVPFIGVLTSEATVREKEKEFFDKLQLDTHSAELVFEEGRSINTSEVISHDKEIILKIITKPKERIAQPDIRGHEVAEMSLVTAEIGMGEVPELTTTSAHAKSSHLPFERIVHCQTSIIESEGKLSTDSIPQSKFAASVLDETQSLIITSTISEDKESTFDGISKPKEQVAESSLSSYEVAEKSELVLGVNVSELDNFEPTPSKAVSGHVPFESIVQTEPIVQEQEKEFIGIFKPEYKKAELDFENKHSLTVSEITLVDKEHSYFPEEIPKDRSAVPVFTDSQEVAKQLQVIPQTIAKEFSEYLPDHDIAKPTQETVQSIVVAENFIQEQEGQFLDKFLPSSKTAIVDIEKGRIAQTVTQVFIKDKESDFESMDILEQKHAQPEIIGREVAEIIETSTEMGIGEVIIETNKHFKATISQTPFETLMQEQAIIQENEGDLKTEFLIATKKAELSFEEGKSLSVTQVNAEDETTPYIVEEVPDSCTANTKILGNEVAEKTEILSEFSLSEFDVTTPKTIKAIPGHVTFETVLQSETLVRESETTFSGVFKPDDRRASITFEEEKGISITEVITDDKENNLVHTGKPVGQKAHPDIEGQEVAQKFEILSQIVPEYLKTQAPEKIIAKIEQGTFSSLMQIEVLVREKEGDYKSDTYVVKKVADLVFEEGQSINVCQVNAEDKETALEHVAKPKSKNAQVSILSQEPIELTDVQPEIPFGKLKIELPTSVTATAEQDFSESILITEDIVHEQEGAFDKTFKPIPSSASVEFEESKGINISEVVTVDKEEKMPALVVPATVNAQSDIFTQEVAEKSEVMINDQIEELISKKSKEIFAKSEHIPLESIIQIQPTIAEVEDELSSNSKPNTKIASLINDFQEGLTIVETIPIEKERDYLHPSIPKVKTVEMGFLDNEAILQTEIILSSSTAEFDDTKVPAMSQITVMQLPFESVETLETTVHENERPLNYSWKPDASNVETKFEEIKSVIVTQVMVQDKEGEEVKSKVRSGEVAHPDIINREIAIKSEVIPISPLEILPEITFPTPSTAKHSTPTKKHSLIVTSLDTGEIESTLPDMITPASKTIAITVEEQKNNLLVTEIHPQDSEGKFSFNITCFIIRSELVMIFMKILTMINFKTFICVGILDF